MSSTLLLLGTRKGAFLLRGGRGRGDWTLDGPHFLGSTAYHLVLDPRDRRTIILGMNAGHLGPTIYRSSDCGRTWQEARRPPAFPKAADDQPSRTVKHIFWLTPGHASEPGVWYAGTSPHGLFRTEDDGDTWQGVAGFNDNPERPAWSNHDNPQYAPPGGATTHSILIDPRDRRHMYLGLSVGGFFESTDQGADWRPLNRGCAGDFLPDPDAAYGQDPHCVRMHPLAPDRLYQQNHCGIYRLDRPSERWTRIGEAMPKEAGDIGFGIALHPRDPDTAWVFPMDGTDVWPRTSLEGRPATYVTRDGGASWRRQDCGLPTHHAWFTVKRQALAADQADEVGVYFGTGQGELWASRDEGESWHCAIRHLPEIYSVEAIEVN